MWEKMNEERKTSIIWYLFPLLLGIFGGIIGYLLLKGRDQKTAKNVLYIGIGTLILGFIILAAIPTPPSSDITPPVTPTPEITPIIAQKITDEEVFKTWWLEKNEDIDAIGEKISQYLLNGDNESAIIEAQNLREYCNMSLEEEWETFDFSKKPWDMRNAHFEAFVYLFNSGAIGRCVEELLTGIGNNEELKESLEIHAKEAERSKHTVDRRLNLKPPEWFPAISFAGSADKTTDEFYIEGDKWRIKYTVTPKAGYSEYSSFGVFVYPAGETALYIATFDCDEGYCSDTQYVHTGSGIYYIVVISCYNNWKLEIEDYY